MGKFRGFWKLSLALTPSSSLSPSSSEYLRLASSWASYCPSEACPMLLTAWAPTPELILLPLLVKVALDL